MCGIAGIFLSRPGSLNISEHLSRMNKTLYARGPDSSGQWSDAQVGIGLGHTRLAILDTSSAGDQPMHSADGRYVLAYNGEVYNFREICDSRLGHASKRRGTSDSEVILECIAQIGIDRAVRLFNGMFAFALWDRRDRALFLVRDRFGVKPMFYGWNQDGLVFGSELKAIRAVSPKLEMNNSVLPGYFRHGYISGSETIYRNIYRVEAGTWIRFDAPEQQQIKSSRYWSITDVAKAGVSSPDECGYHDVCDKLHAILLNSVSLRMISDVPIGAFLSGGIDSSLVVALMQRLSGAATKTFTIGFHSAECNEAPYAAAIAKHLGTDHTELYVSESDVLEVVSSLSRVYDEPFGDSSQIPTILLSQLTRRHVTVSLSGDGGDELFCGYPRYHATAKYAPYLSSITRIPRQALAAIVRISGGSSGRIQQALAKLLPAQSDLRLHSESLLKLEHVLKANDAWGLYDIAITQWFDEQGLLLNIRDDRMLAMPDIGGGIYEKMMLYDQMTYLPDDILVKVDRASMSASLESREPLLDPRLVEYAWQIPMSYKIRGHASKIILKDLLSRYVPRELFERPKLGFGAPIGDWLRTVLRDWAEELLNSQKMEEEGMLNVRLVRQKWQEHLSGVANWQYPLWYVLMFQDWLRTSRSVW
jgi:asparagine synthase (glutamine-hydrolysing)